MRNNMLYAAASIPVQQEMSLLDVVKTNFLPDNRCIDAANQDTLMRGYALQCDPIVLQEQPNRSKIVFRILLFGNYAVYAELFHQAIVSMCTRGIGRPMTAMQIIEHKRFTIEATSREQKWNEIEFNFITPMSLYNNRANSMSRQSVLDRQNGIPSLYFLTRGLAHRINKLSWLYGNGKLYPDDEIDNWCEEARNAQLEDCQLQRVVLKGTPHTSGKKPIFYSGYMGNMTFSGVPQKYLALLHLGTQTNVGNDTVYGIGHYELNYL